MKIKMDNLIKYTLNVITDEYHIQSRFLYHKMLLRKGEFTKGMKAARDKRGPEAEQLRVPDEQILTLFEMMDEGKDGLLTYGEFQATMPQQPKSLEETTEESFKEADANSDNELSEVVDYTLNQIDS